MVHNLLRRSFNQKMLNFVQIRSSTVYGLPQIWSRMKST